jgi:hypothetical protein
MLISLMLGLSQTPPACPFFILLPWLTLRSLNDQPDDHEPRKPKLRTTTVPRRPAVGDFASPPPKLTRGRAGFFGWFLLLGPIDWALRGIMHREI